MKKTSYPVSSRAVIARVQRRLNAKGQRLVKNKTGSAAEKVFGPWSIQNEGRYTIADHVDVEALARELQALQPFEHMEKP